MVAELHWLAVGGFSMIMTLCWLYIEKRIVLSGLLAASGWAYMALTGQSVVKYTEAGVAMKAPVGDLAYLCSALAIASFLAVVLYWFGDYPPRDDDPAANIGEPKSPYNG